MSGNLERRPSNAGGVARGYGSVSSGQATSLSELTFSKKALIYAEDMPTQFRQGVQASTAVVLREAKTARSGGELILASDAESIISPRSSSATRKIEKAVIASGMRQLEKPRKSADRVVQRRIGWQATPKLIVITTAERELTKNANGKYAPAGDWLIEDRRTYEHATDKAAKRTGTVAVDTTSENSPTKHQTESSGVETSVAESFPEGANALGMLPAAVRASAIGRVPAPTQFDGVILQQVGDDGSPTSLEVNVLRMDTDRGVVIQASRGVSDDEWNVSQASYQLKEPVIEQA